MVVTASTDTEAATREHPVIEVVWLARFTGTDDGLVILATGSGRVDVIDVRTRAVTSEPRITMATCGDLVAVASEAQPEVVALPGLPGTARHRRVALDGNLPSPGSHPRTNLRQTSRSPWTM